MLVVTDTVFIIRIDAATDHQKIILPRRLRGASEFNLGSTIDH
jgi:hypothetical protein